jgi:hypothetical protein
MSADLESNIKKWVSLDNEIKQANEKLKKLRESRNDTSVDILNYIHENELDNATIKISDGQLKFAQVKQQNPLTYKFINECLKKCINNEEQVELIMNFIKDQRESKVQTEIKRHYFDKE